MHKITIYIFNNLFHFFISFLCKTWIYQLFTDFPTRFPRHDFMYFYKSMLLVYNYKPFPIPRKAKKEFLPNQKLFFKIYLFFLTPSGTNVLQS